MCLYIKKEEQTKIAENNIPCYKQLREGNRSTIEYYKYYKFSKNRNVNIQDDNDIIIRNAVTFGYHSRKEHNRENKTHLFVIPKDSKYYEGSENNSYRNTDDGYVSSQIIYIGKNTAFNRWIGKVFYNVEFKSVEKLYSQIYSNT